MTITGTIAESPLSTKLRKWPAPTLTISEACAIVGTSKTALYEAIRDSKLRVVEGERRTLIQPTDLRKWIQRQEDDRAAASNPDSAPEPSAPQSGCSPANRTIEISLLILGRGFCGVRCGCSRLVKRSNQPFPDAARALHERGYDDDVILFARYFWNMQIAGSGKIGDLRRLSVHSLTPPVPPKGLYPPTSHPASNSAQDGSTPVPSGDAVEA